jgi:MFS family permease
MKPSKNNRNILNSCGIANVKIDLTQTENVPWSQTLAGRLIDKTGTRLGMLVCVATWSVVSMLHGLSTGVLSFGILRFLLGIAEAGNWPGAVKAVSENFPLSRRAFAVGVFNSGSTAGAILAPPLVSTVTANWGWRLMLVVVGLSGFIWMFLWNARSAVRRGRITKLLRLLRRAEQRCCHWCSRA